MTKRIFYYMVLLGTVILVATLGLVVLLLDDARVNLALWDVVLPLVAVFAIGLVLSAVLAFRLAKAIVKPLESLDLSAPEAEPVYDELKPMLHKIRRQNVTIRDQLRDLIAQQEEFKAIAQNMSEGLLVVDRNGTVLTHNGAALRLLDVRPEDEGNPVADWHRSRRFKRAVAEALAGQHSQQQMQADARTYQVIGNPVVKDGQTVGAVIMLLDVTEREERDRLRREFSANVSHELKTPLTSISGYAEIMMNGVAKPEDMPRFAASIYEEARRMTSLVNDILQLSRLDEQDMSDALAPVELLALARQIAERFRPAAEQGGLTLRVQGEACMVAGVAQVLDEMITNLCDNAVKYNRPGGSVTVSVTRRAEDGRVRLAVADTGVGIAYEDQPRVFERFFRADKSRSRRVGGTGLGLSIVKHGAMVHNALLNLESVPGEGTCISVVFPPAPPDDAATET